MGDVPADWSVRLDDRSRQRLADESMLASPLGVNALLIYFANRLFPPLRSCRRSQEASRA